MESMDLIKAAITTVEPAKAAKLGGVKLDTEIRSLGMDSVATMEMVSYLEEQLHATFPDEALTEINTFGDLVKLIDRTKAAG